MRLEETMRRRGSTSGPASWWSRWHGKLIRFFLLLQGKLRRFYLVHMRKGYVETQLVLREGECLQCGQCCAFIFGCPMLNSEGLCRVYDSCRWRACRVFPIDERDLADVTAAGGRCGYSFPDSRHKWQFILTDCMGLGYTKPVVKNGVMDRVFTERHPHLKAGRESPGR